VTDPRIERWLDLLLATQGLTSIRDREKARRVHVEQSLVALEAVEASGSPVVDVGSGGGAPGLPLASALPELAFVLLEANARKCAFLEKAAAEFPNVSVARGRAEDQPAETFRTAVAKALARPPVAVELCLPLLQVGGTAIVYVGATADAGAALRAAEMLNGELEEQSGYLLVRKLGPTPPGFPRRAGMAKKRPLA
jgi:16S rRNA (guanine527-N7)-methyltransferase